MEQKEEFHGFNRKDRERFERERTAWLEQANSKALAEEPKTSMIDSIRNRHRNFESKRLQLR